MKILFAIPLVLALVGCAEPTQDRNNKPMGALQGNVPAVWEWTDPDTGCRYLYPNRINTTLTVRLRANGLPWCGK